MNSNLEMCREQRPSLSFSNLYLGSPSSTCSSSRNHRIVGSGETLTKNSTNETLFKIELDNDDL